MIRKNSYCNHSERGALTQPVLMSVLRTLRLRGHNPIDELLEALVTYSKTGNLPPIPLQAPESLHGKIAPTRVGLPRPCYLRLGQPSVLLPIVWPMLS